jgi:YVTN family beta-propeller protein
MKTKCPLPKRFSGTRGVSGILIALLTLVLSTASVAGAAPFAYVSNFMSNTLSVVDPTAARPIATVTVGQLPLGVAVNPSSTRVYVANSWDGTVSVIDTASNTVVATVPVGTNPTGVAVNATGTRVYVANQGTVSVINTATNAVVATISTPGLRQIFGIAINPAGSRVYLSDTAANVVGVIDATNNTFMGVLAVGLAPMGLAVDPSGTRVYVANQSTSPTTTTRRSR